LGVYRVSLSRRSLITVPFVLSIAAARAQESLSPLTIHTQSGKSHAFRVEIAVGDEQRARGLMFRRFMPEDRGMLFDFKRDGDVAMWMRNTYISLDMLFIRADGVIHHIAHRTEPFSERTISSNGPVRAVLEINGGICAKLGIAPGDLVVNAAFPAKR
jgi:hypothetical protein